MKQEKYQLTPPPPPPPPPHTHINPLFKKTYLQHTSTPFLIFQSPPMEARGDAELYDQLYIFCDVSSRCIFKINQILINVLKVATLSSIDVLQMGCGVLYIIIQALVKDAEKKHATIIFNHFKLLPTSLSRISAILLWYLSPVTYLTYFTEGIIDFIRT